MHNLNCDEAAQCSLGEDILIRREGSSLILLDVSKPTDL